MQTSLFVAILSNGNVEVESLSRPFGAGFECDNGQLHLSRLLEPPSANSLSLPPSLTAFLSFRNDSPGAIVIDDASPKQTQSWDWLQMGLLFFLFRELSVQSLFNLVSRTCSLSKEGSARPLHCGSLKLGARNFAAENANHYVKFTSFLSLPLAPSPPPSLLTICRVLISGTRVQQ